MYALLPCSRCTLSEPQYERRRVSFRSQWESPTAGTWKILDRPVVDDTRLYATVLREYLLLTKKERRSIRAGAMDGKRRVTMYARLAVAFKVADEDFLAARMAAPEGSSNAAVGRTLGISRQLAWKRSKSVRERMERLREAAMI